MGLQWGAGFVSRDIRARRVGVARQGSSRLSWPRSKCSSPSGKVFVGPDCAHGVLTGSRHLPHATCGATGTRPGGIRLAMDRCPLIWGLSEIAVAVQRG